MSQRNRLGLLVLNRDFRVMSADRAAVEQLGSPRAGRECRLDRFFHAADASTVRAAINETLNTGKSIRHCPGRVRRPDHEPVLCDISVLPVFKDDRHIIGVILGFENAAQRAGAAEAVSEQSDLNGIGDKAVYDWLPQGAFTVDLQRRITSFNRAAEVITGFSKNEAIGRRCRDIFRSNRCRRDCPLTETLTGGNSSWDQRVHALHHGGEHRCLVVNVSAVRNEAGEVVGALEVFHDAERTYAATASPRVSAVLNNVVGESRQMRKLLAMLPAVAASGACVLISGETGTGKDLVAEAIHQLSVCRKGPFVPVNCSAFAETLLESELFGHEKGAFTGAEVRNIGRLEKAAGGTLFLDEIGELKPELQVKLLRVLDQRSFERVGGIRSIPLKARIVSATNRNLKKSMQADGFRKDLYFRLRTVALHLPALRDRLEDIPLLTSHFIRRCNQKYGKSVRIVDPKVMRMFQRYRWPGNVRELERTIEHAFVFVKGKVIFPRHLPELEGFGMPTPAGPVDGRLAKTLNRNTLLWALAQTAGNRGEAAALLGISRTSMWRRMKATGLLGNGSSEAAGG